MFETRNCVLRKMQERSDPTPNGLMPTQSTHFTIRTRRHKIKRWNKIHLESKWRNALPLHPGRLKWNLRIYPCKRKSIFQNIIFRFCVNLRGVVFVYHGLSNKSPAKLGVASGDRHRSFYYDQIFDCPSCHNHS